MEQRNEEGTVVVNRCGSKYERNYTKGVERSSDSSSHSSQHNTIRIQGLSQRTVKFNNDRISRA